MKLNGYMLSVAYFIGVVLNKMTLPMRNVLNVEDTKKHAADNTEITEDVPNFLHEIPNAVLFFNNFGL